MMVEGRREGSKRVRGKVGRARVKQSV